MQINPLSTCKIFDAQENKGKHFRCVLQVAGNDACEAPASAVIGRYEDLISDIKSRCPKADIIVSKIPMRHDGERTLETQKSIEKVNSYLFTRSLIRGDVTFMDACPVFPSMFNKGKVHFSSEGCNFMANAMHRFLVNFHRRHNHRIT